MCTSVRLTLVSNSDGSPDRGREGRALSPSRLALLANSDGRRPAGRAHSAIRTDQDFAHLQSLASHAQPDRVLHRVGRTRSSRTSRSSESNGRSLQSSGLCALTPSRIAALAKSDGSDLFGRMRKVSRTGETFLPKNVLQIGELQRAIRTGA